MNAWQKQNMEADENGLNEVCDRCGRDIIHWDTMTHSFLAANGVDICCWICKNIEDEKLHHEKLQTV